ncbi:MAG TPA: hypothetical protein VGJ00_06710 [Rhabdochlamydiaceae bacterium]|jgi:hypothetical protein
MTLGTFRLGTDCDYNRAHTIHTEAIQLKSSKPTGFSLSNINRVLRHANCILNSIAEGEPLDAEGRVIDQVTIRDELRILSQDLSVIEKVARKRMSTQEDRKKYIGQAGHIIEGCSLLHAAGFFMQAIASDVEEELRVQIDAGTNYCLPDNLNVLVREYVTSQDSENVLRETPSGKIVCFFTVSYL